MNIIQPALLSCLDTFHSKQKNEIISEIENIATKFNYPIIRPDTARFIKVLLTIYQPLNVLEIGCSIGYSTSLIATYLKEGGKITTIERYNPMIQKAKQTFKFMDVEDKVELLEGDAKNILPTLDQKYDLVFLDAAKGQYINFLPHCLRLLDNEGIFIADDVLQGGSIKDNIEDIPRRQRTIHKRMIDFIKEVCNLKEYETTVLTIGDGLLISVSKNLIEKV